MLFLLIVGVLQAAPSPQGPSLKGVNNICVFVEELDEDAKRGGLDASTIQTDVELKLRTAGIRVLPVRTPRPYGCAVFKVVVSVAKPRAGRVLADAVYGYQVDAMLLEVAKLDRTGDLVMSSTWDRSMFGILGSSTVATLRDTVKDFTDVFVNEYLKANQK